MSVWYIILVFAAGLLAFCAVVLGLLNPIAAKKPNLSRYLPKAKRASGILIAIAGLAVVLLHASAWQTAPDAGTTPATTAESAQQVDFEAQDLDGNTVRLSDYRGRPVCIKLWASWCPVCLSGMTEFASLASEANEQGDYQVLSLVSPGISGEKERDEFVSWSRSQNLDFPILMDETGTVVRLLDVEAYPTHVFVDAKGNVAKTRIGDMSPDDVKAELASLAAEGAGDPADSSALDGANGLLGGSSAGLTAAESASDDAAKEKGTDVHVNEDNLHEVYFAGGCFWGVEEYFSRIPGVADAESGYANSTVENPSYQEVCSGVTHAAETVRVTYDPDIVSLATLTRQFFKIIDPTSVNQQGNDRGEQYRSGVYYTDEGDIDEISMVFDEVRGATSGSVVTELEPLQNFFVAGDYHQDYLQKNPGGYCHIDFGSLDEVILEAPQMSVNASAYSKPSNEELRASLTDEAYRITQDEGTERAYTGAYYDTFAAGIYVDVATGEPLFSSEAKYDSGCGWPAFWQPIDNDVLIESADTSYGMVRTEVKSRVGGSHLGHKFQDGPPDHGHVRYCIDSAALRFIPYDQMDAEGYGAYKRVCAYGGDNA